MKLYSLAGFALPLVYGQQGQETNADIPSGTIRSVLPMTDEFREQFVDAHNYWRSSAALGRIPDRNSVTKQATYMPKMRYDMELEKSALKYAKLCNGDKSMTAGFTTLPYGTGENQYIYGSTRTIGSDYTVGPSILMIVTSWATQHSYYNYDHLTCADQQTCDHFTQIVNKRSSRIGCAIVECNSIINYDGNIDGNFDYNSLFGVNVICQYYGAGNDNGESPYHYGDVGSSCETGMDDEYPGLCKHDDDDICDVKHSTAPNRCGTQGSCSPAEAPVIFNAVTTFSCTCEANYVGRWCHENTCRDTRILVGQKPIGDFGMYFRGNDFYSFSDRPIATATGGYIHLYPGSQFNDAMHWCSSNSDNDFACKSVVKTDFENNNGWYFWVPSRYSTAEMMTTYLISDVNTDVWERNCSPSSPVEEQEEGGKANDKKETADDKREEQDMVCDAVDVQYALTNADSQIKIGSANGKTKCVTFLPKKYKSGKVALNSKGSIAVATCDPTSKFQKWNHIAEHGLVCLLHKYQKQAKKGWNLCLNSHTFSTFNKDMGITVGQVGLKLVKNKKDVPESVQWTFSNGRLHPKADHFNGFSLVWEPKFFTKQPNKLAVAKVSMQSMF